VNWNKVDTSVIILTHILNSVRDTWHVVGVGGTIMALALGLNLGDQVDKLPIKFGGGCLDLLSCVRIGLVSLNTGQYTLSSHGTPLFSLPNPIKTTIANKSNWTSDNEIKAKGDDEEQSEEPMDGSKTTKADKSNWICDNEIKAERDDEGESKKPMDGFKTTIANKSNGTYHNVTNAEGYDEEQMEEPMDEQPPQPSTDIVEPSWPSQQGIDSDM